MKYFSLFNSSFVKKQKAPVLLQVTGDETWMSMYVHSERSHTSPGVFKSHIYSDAHYLENSSVLGSSLFLLNLKNYVLHSYAQAIII